jgi:hypothetical protein
VAGPDGGPLVPVKRRIVEWDPNTGEPVVRVTSIFTKAQVSQIAMAAASMPYVDPDDELRAALGLPLSEFAGMTNLEVMLIRQARRAAESGEPEAFLDRLVGKPTQSVEKHTITETYEGFLDRTAASIKDKPIDVTVEADALRDL